MPLILDIHRHVPGLTEDAALRVHREAHGLVPDDIIEVQEGR